MGVSFIALPAILRKEGFAIEHIGMLGVVMIPWALKFLWAPWIDRRTGGSFLRRKRLIVPAQLIQAGLFLIIALLPRDVGAGYFLFVCLLLANTVAATQDIGTDGLAVESLSKQQFGWVNAGQIGGFSLGMVIGGSLTLALYQFGGWGLCFVSLAVITLLTLLPVLQYKSDFNQLEENAVEPISAKASLKRFFERKNALYILSIAASFYFARSMVGVMSQPFMVDAGFHLNTIALINGIAVTFMTITSAVIGGLFVNRYGANRVAIISGFASAFSLALWLLPSYFGLTSLLCLVLVVLVNGFFGGVAYVAFFTVFMRWASREQAGTDFSTLQSTETITNVIAAMFAGFIAGGLGFSLTFIVAAVLAVLIMIWISLALRHLHGGELT